MPAPENPIVLSLAHSPDPDDAFMWWPITGKVVAPAAPSEIITPAEVLEPANAARYGIDTGRFRFTAFPADIEVLNRQAAKASYAPTPADAANSFDITALSVRTWVDVQDQYLVTSCGASFGDGYGPRLVARATDATVLCELCLDKPGLVIAIPGRGTTAFLMLQLLLRDLYERRLLSRKDGQAECTFIEMPFDRVIPAVVQGDADVGLVIHEGQISFADSGLCTIADVGDWWKQHTGLKLPLGVNAIRCDLDERFGAGTVAQVSAILQKSVAVAMENWDESVRYALTFAEANAARSRGATATLDRVEQYCRMYVTEETRDMGDAGREAVRRLLAEGAAAGLCPVIDQFELV